MPQEMEDAEPHVAASKRVRLDSSDTVVVACKLPNGLEIYDEDIIEIQEQMFGGGTRTVKRYQRTGEGYKLNGNRFTRLGADDEAPHLIVGGFGITSGIPKEFWERWVERHKSVPFVKNGLVKAFNSEPDVRKYARTNEKMKSGLEPIDPENPQRFDAKVQRGSVASDNEMA